MKEILISWSQLCDKVSYNCAQFRHDLSSSSAYEFVVHHYLRLNSAISIKVLINLWNRMIHISISPTSKTFLKRKYFQKLDKH